MDVTMHSCWVLCHVSIRAIYCQASIFHSTSTGDPFIAQQRKLQKDPEIMDILEADCKKKIIKKCPFGHFSKLISEFGMQVWAFFSQSQKTVVVRAKLKPHTHHIGSGCMRGSALEMWISGGLSELLAWIAMHKLLKINMEWQQLSSAFSAVTSCLNVPSS